MNNFEYLRTETYDHDARDATFTLNMLKIKNNENDDILKNEKDNNVEL